MFSSDYYISAFVHVSDGASNGSDRKKMKVDEAPALRVLHLQKLPSEASDAEVIAPGLPFGKVTNILILKGKNQVSGGKAQRLILQHVINSTGNRWNASLRVMGRFCLRCKSIIVKYLGVLFLSDGRMEREINPRITALSSVMRALLWSVLVKKEFN